MNENLVFLKLGGSLITDKTGRRAVREEILERAAGEIAAAMAAKPKLRLLLGHGSGSFAHVPASKWKTRQGVRSVQEWGGFLEVRREAAELNHIVARAMIDAGVRAVTFPPSAGVTAVRGQVVTWDLLPLLAALHAGFTPVVYGDAVFDLVLGGTILSTEELFIHLARELEPKRLLIAGIEAGVWEDYPRRSKLVRHISPQDGKTVGKLLRGSAGTDVTGGMESKVRSMLELVDQIPELEVMIFSGVKEGSIERALMGEALGTKLTGGLQNS